MSYKALEQRNQLIIGQNLRRLREYRGLSQTELGQALGLTFQQIQKYEKGSCSFPAARLYSLSQILHINCENFFAGLDDAALRTPAPTAINPAILSRALKIQTRCSPATRQKILRVIDILTN